LLPSASLPPFLPSKELLPMHDFVLCSGCLCSGEVLCSGRLCPGLLCSGPGALRSGRLCLCGFVLRAQELLPA